jgi:hypothetical protein
MNVEHWSLYGMKSRISEENQPSVAMVSNTCAKILQMFLITNSNPWRRVPLEKLIVPKLVTKFPAFYGTQRFITMFTRAHHLSLS